MTQPAEHPMPQGGGTWIRHADGSLTQDEAPTAPADSPPAPETPVEEAVKAPVKRPVKEA
jgi:hypothetical protein